MAVVDVIEPSIIERGIARARPAKTVPKWLKAAIYGDSGVGKTALCGTVDQCYEGANPSTSLGLQRACMIDVEGGALTISQRDVDVIRVTTWEQCQAVYDELFYMKSAPDVWLTSVENRLAKGEDVWFDRLYDVAFVDSLTELHKMCMDTVLDEMIRKRPDRERIPDKREWGICNERVRNFVRAMRDLPDMHVVMTFLQKEDEEAVTKDKVVRPNVPGKLAGEIPGFFDLVGYLRVSSRQAKDEAGNNVLVDERQLFVQRTGMYQAKNRYAGLLEPMLVNPTMHSLLAPILATA
jgi:hypothetical protein